MKMNLGKRENIFKKLDETNL